MSQARAKELDIPGVLLITPKRSADSRGAFTELYQADVYARLGVAGPFVQDNMARSARRGTLRGLHFQRPPAVQGKLIWCVRGAVFDVIVDLRAGAPTYGRHIGVRLSAEEGAQIWAPGGVAHGYLTLEDDSCVAYKTTAPYRPDLEGGLRWNDAALGVQWPIAPAEVSERDQAWGDFAGFVTPF